MGILPLPYSARIDAINELIDGFIKLDGGMPQAVTLANIAVSGSASDLTSGTLADARLSSNVPLKNAANTFTEPQTATQFNVSTDYSWIREVFAWPQDGGYNNIVSKLGYNVNRADAAKASIHQTFESKYLLNNVGPYVCEYHIEGHHSNGTTYRTFSMIVPHSASDANAGSSVGFYAQKFVNYAFDGSERIQYNWATNVVSYITAQQHRLGTNNHNFFNQLNAAGNAWLNLPFIDNADRLYTNVPAYQVAAATPAKPVQQVVAITSGQNPVVWQVNAGGTETGTMRMYYGIVSRTGPATIEILNNGTGQYSNSEIVLSVSATGGDACIRTATTGNVGVVQGYDRSAGLYRFADNAAGYWLGSGGAMLDMNPTTKAAIFYGTVQVGTSGPILKNSSGTLQVRNSADSAFANIETANGTFSGHITSAFQSLSADPSTADLSAGQERLVKNTTSGQIRRFVNDGGTIKKSPEYTI